MQRKLDTMEEKLMIQDKKRKALHAHNINTKHTDHKENLIAFISSD